MNIRICVIITVVCCCSLKAQAAEIAFSYAREDGGLPGAFLQFGASTRSLAMGRAHTAITDDASSVYANPAGLLQLESPQATALYSILWEDTSYSAVTYAHPFHSGVIGVGIINLASNDFDKRTYYNQPNGDAAVSENCALLSYARTVYGIDCGATLKVLYQKMDTYSATGFGADAGVQYALPYDLAAGVALQNVIQPALTLNRDTDYYPLATNAGLAWFPNDNWTVSAEVQWQERTNPTPKLGVEYIVLKCLALRSGINKDELTAGFGMKVKNFSIGYAFSYQNPTPGFSSLDPSHRFDIGYWFK
jgi:hypothetical protein